MVTIHIKTDNAAFEGDNRAHELARILRALADRIERGGPVLPRLNDINGNRVGSYRTEE